MIRKLPLFIVLCAVFFIPQGANATKPEDLLYDHLQTMTYKYGLLAKVHEALTSANNRMIRAMAATYLGRYGTYESVPLLINALSDESTYIDMNSKNRGLGTTRHRAYLALKELTGEDFGFQWNSPIEERNVAIKKYKAWLKERDKIIELVRAYLKENNMDKYSIYRMHFINKEKTKWGAALTQDPPMFGAPVLTIDRQTHEINMIMGR